VKQSLHSTTLDNGLTLVGENLPGLESVAVAFHTPAGAIHDGPGRCGLATLAGEMCLRGAGDRTSREVVEAFESAGVQWSQGVSTTHTSFSGAMVARQLPGVLPIYADLLRRPTLPEDEFAAAQQMVLQNLAGLEDDPAHLAFTALRRIHQPAPWHRPTEGISAEVTTVAPADVRRFAGDEVEFADGRRAAFDVVICATGYRPTLPFIDPRLLGADAADGLPRLFLNLLHPVRDDIAVVGLIQPDSGQWGITDLQSRLVARMAVAALRGPRAAAWLYAARQRPQTAAARYVDSPRHALEVEHYSYRRRLERLVAGMDRRMRTGAPRTITGPVAG